jgi:hypothetical protein
LLTVSWRVRKSRKRRIVTTNAHVKDTVTTNLV